MSVPDSLRHFFVKSSCIVTPTSTIDGALEILGEKIVAVHTKEELKHQNVENLIDFGSYTIFPGVVDAHAHINEPGRTQWEGFETATRSAAAGGITTVVDMPLNSIPATTTLKALFEKLEATQGKCYTDFGLWGGVVPGNSQELRAMTEAGALGFKCFLTPSGVDEFPHVSRDDLEIAMPILREAGVPCLVHAELEHAEQVPVLPRSSRRYLDYLFSRPRAWENAAIELMVDLCRKTRCRTHIVHLSSSDALSIVAAAKSEGLPFTAETCPHYLTLAAEEIPDGATQFKCAPPIRERSNREALWEAVKNSTLDFIVSDHSPCAPQLKLLESGDFLNAWGGISSLQLGLSLNWTEGKKRGLNLQNLAALVSERTARFAGLFPSKGQLAPGADADFVVFDAEATFQVEGALLFHRHGVTPYLGRVLNGKVRETWLRGVKIFDGNKHCETPIGRFVTSRK